MNSASAIRASSEVIGRDLDTTLDSVITARQSLMDIGRMFRDYVGGAGMEVDLMSFMDEHIRPGDETVT